MVQMPAPGEDAPPARPAEQVLGGTMLDQLRSFRPHVVGFRLIAGYLQPLQQAIEAVRSVCDATIVLGGPTVTSHPAEVLQATGADYAFAGEAEETFALFLALAHQPESARFRAHIPGLAYRFAGEYQHNTLPVDGYGRNVLERGGRTPGDLLRCSEPGAAVVRAPAPQKSALDLRRLRNTVRPVADREVMRANRLNFSLLVGFDEPQESLFFTGSRGCPGACAFCAKLHGNEVRAKTAEQLMDEITAADRAVAEGRLKLSRWRLFEFCPGDPRREEEVAWVSIYDEDFFLARNRAMRFFSLWEASDLARRYRISVQTNPCSLLDRRGAFDAALREVIARHRPMVQLGAESFHPQLLARWQKRHTIEQLITVLDALETCHCDYTIFHLLTDLESTLEEVLDSLYLLAEAAWRHRRMRIASNPFTLPLFDSDIRRRLEFATAWDPRRVRSFTDYEQPQPAWMDPLVAALADVTEPHLHWALYPRSRDAALLDAVDAAAAFLENDAGRMIDATSRSSAYEQLAACRHQARWVARQVRQSHFAHALDVL